MRVRNFEIGTGSTFDVDLTITGLTNNINSGSTDSEMVTAKSIYNFVVGDIPDTGLTLEFDDINLHSEILSIDTTGKTLTISGDYTDKISDSDIYDVCNIVEDITTTEIQILEYLSITNVYLDGSDTVVNFLETIENNYNYNYLRFGNKISIGGNVSDIGDIQCYFGRIDNEYFKIYPSIYYNENDNTFNINFYNSIINDSDYNCKIKINKIKK